MPNEISAYELARTVTGTDFRAARAGARRDIENNYADLLQQYGIIKDRSQALVAAVNGEHLGELKDQIVRLRDQQVKDLTAAHDAAKSSPAATTPAPSLSANPLANPADAPAATVDRPTRDHDVDAQFHRDVEQIYAVASDQYDGAELVKNSGIFDEFFGYERGQFNITINAVKRLSWVDGYHAVQRFFMVGPVWLLTQHTVYFFLFLILFMTVWAVFGGAIARIAAVHVARDEKLSIRAALRFSTGKFLSFLFAPLIPLMIVGALGLVLTVSALVVLNIPFFGPIVAGALFFLALGIGFLMALVLVGTVGGFNLMYPTIAIEGSDSFDAISRSFSYLYARPWRMIFYTVVAVMYGAITYTVLKLFIALMFDLVHGFMSFGVFRSANNQQPLFNMLWPGTGSFEQLSYPLKTLTLGPGETLGAYLIAMWVYIVVAILGAFAISFYFSANTIIYYLMRTEVDATDSDDVYIEQQDDDTPEAEPAPAAAPAAASPAPLPVAPEPPPTPIVEAPAADTPPPT